MPQRLPGQPDLRQLPGLPESSHDHPQRAGAMMSAARRSASALGRVRAFLCPSSTKSAPALSSPRPGVGPRAPPRVFRSRNHG